MEKKKVLVAVGTRPEAIKMAPVIKALEESAELSPITCATGQHRDLLDQVLELFDIKPDHDLDLMRPNQDLFQITASCLLKTRELLQSTKPDCVLVQGDTATAFTMALAAFYQKIPVGHVEAGLRTWNRYSPFPEEIYRRMLTQIAELHFPPTEMAQANLIKENVDPESIFKTGNTGIDALLWMAERAQCPKDLTFLDPRKKMVLLTSHRRENFGEPLTQIFSAVRTFAERYPECHFVYPVHPNPNVKGPAYQYLSECANISLIAPVGYDELVFLLGNAHFVLTDSGGIQEEAPSFGKPILVLRDTTERPEAVEAGCALLVGTDRDTILDHMESLYRTDSELYAKMANRGNPFGDGKAAKRIIRALEEKLHAPLSLSFPKSFSPAIAADKIGLKS